MKPYCHHVETIASMVPCILVTYIHSRQSRLNHSPAEPRQIYFNENSVHLDHQKPAD